MAARATDMVLKLDWLHATYGPKVVTFATGTPVANSLAEMWVLQRFLAHDQLEAAEMGSFDSWAGTFAHSVTRMELAPEGGRFRMQTRIAAFDNVPELLTTFRQFCDLLDPADLPSLKIPALAGGRADTVVVAATDELHTLITDLGERADRIRSRQVAAEDDNMLKVCNDGRLGSLDLRLVAADQPPGTGKIAAAAGHIAGLWERYRDTVYTDSTGAPSPRPGGLQIVFCDKGTPQSNRWNVYDELRDQLVAAGMDPARIRFIHQASTDTAKEALFQACRAGEVDVLIGSTDKMGTGANIQNRLVALHHLDAPWRPADIEQREGRILRHGNQNPAVHVVRYVTEASFDPYMWQTLERKARFISQVMSPVPTADAARSIEDLDTELVLSYAEIKAVATGNPLIRDHAEVASTVARLSRLADNHTKEQRALPGRLARLRGYITELAVRIDRLEDITGRLVDTRGDRFRLTLTSGRTVTDRPAAGDALRALADRTPADKAWYPAGNLAGLDWEISRHPDPTSYGTQWIRLRTVDDDGTLDWTRHDFAGGQPHQLAIRMERHAEGFRTRLDQARTQIQTTREQVVRGEASLGRPFTHSDELARQTIRLADLTGQLEAMMQPPATPDPTVDVSVADPTVPLPVEDLGIAPTPPPVAGPEIEL